MLRSTNVGTCLRTAVPKPALPVGIALFGSPAVSAADGSRQFALPRRSLDVLAYLILHRRRPPTRAATAFTLFADEDEDAARGNLRRNLSQLPSALPDSPGEPFVIVDGEYLRWNPRAPAVMERQNAALLSAVPA